MNRSKYLTRLKRGVADESGSENLAGKDHIDRGHFDRNCMGSHAPMSHSRHRHATESTERRLSTVVGPSEEPRHTPNSIFRNEDRDWILEHLSELTKQYPDEVIAVLHGKVIAHHVNGRVVRAQLAEQRLEGEPVIWFLEALGRVYAG